MRVKTTLLRNLRGMQNLSILGYMGESLAGNCLLWQRGVLGLAAAQKLDASSLKRKWLKLRRNQASRPESGFRARCS